MSAFPTLQKAEMTSYLYYQHDLNFPVSDKTVLVEAKSFMGDAVEGQYVCSANFNSVACLLLHLTCAKACSTLPWGVCGIVSGSWERGWGLGLQKEEQMCCRTCAKQCLKADDSCPGPGCNSPWTPTNSTDWFICYSRGLAPMMGLL